MPSTKKELQEKWSAKFIELGFTEALFGELLECDIDFSDLLHRCTNLKENCNQHNANLFSEIKLVHLLALSGNAKVFRNYINFDEQRINIKDNAERTVIHYLAMLGDQEVIIEFLAKHPERQFEKDRHGKDIKDYFNLCMNFETPESIEPIIQSAMISAIPILAERLFVPNHPLEQHAFDTLMNLAAAQNVEAINCLEENANDFFERFKRLANDDKDLAQHHSKLKRWATARVRLACVLKAAQLWDDHWWEKTGKFRKDETKFSSMQAHHEKYYAVRLAENKFDIYMEGGSSYKAEQAFKHAIAAAQKTDEGYYLLGMCLIHLWHYTNYIPEQYKGNYGPCIAFANNVRNKNNRFFHASLREIQHRANCKDFSIEERTFAAVIVWQTTGNIQFLKDAMQINSAWVAFHVNASFNQFTFEQGIEVDAFLLNNPTSMADNYVELTFGTFEQLILKKLSACKTINEALNILELTLDKITTSPKHYQRLAIHIIDDGENLSPAIRAATMIKLFNKLNLTEDVKNQLFKLLKTFPPAIRSEIQLACPNIQWASCSVLLSSSIMFKPAPASSLSSSSSSSSSCAEGLSASMLPSAPTTALEASLVLPSVPRTELEHDKQKEQLSAQMTRK